MNKVVLVSELPDNFTIEDIRQQFSNAGKVLQVRQVLNNSAYVEYSTSQEAESATTTKYTGQGKKLEVCLYPKYLEQNFLNCPYSKHQNNFEITVPEVFFKRLVNNVKLLKTQSDIINRLYRRFWLRKPKFIGITSLGNFEKSVRMQATAAKRFQEAFISHVSSMKFSNTESQGNENGLETAKPVEIIVPQISSDIVNFFSLIRVLNGWHEKYEGIKLSLDKEQASITLCGPGNSVVIALKEFVEYIGSIGKLDIEVSEHVAKMYGGEDLKAWVQQTMGSIDKAHHWEIDKTNVSVIAQKDDHSLFKEVFQTAFREHDMKHADAQTCEELMQWKQIPKEENKEESITRNTNTAHKHERDLKNTALKKSENTSVVETNSGEENDTSAHEQNNKQLDNDLHVFDVGPEPLDPESKDEGQTEKDLQSNTAETVTEMSMNETEDLSENTDDTLSLTSFEILEKTEDQEKEELDLSDSETVCGHSNDSRCDQGNQQKDVSVGDENSGGSILLTAKGITQEPPLWSMPGSSTDADGYREISDSGSFTQKGACAGVSGTSGEQTGKTLAWEQLHCLSAEQLIIVAGYLGISNSMIAELKARYSDEKDFRSNLIERCSSAGSVEQLCHALVLLIQSDCSPKQYTDCSVGATPQQLGAKSKMPAYNFNTWPRKSAKSSRKRLDTMYNHSAGLFHEANAFMSHSVRPKSSFSAFSCARKLDRSQPSRGFLNWSVPTEQELHGAWSRQLSEPTVKGKHISSTDTYTQTDLMESSSVNLTDALGSLTNVQGTQSSRQQAGLLTDLHDMESSMTARMETRMMELFAQMENRMEEQMLVLSQDLQEECEQMSLRMRTFKMQIRNNFESRFNQLLKQMDLFQSDVMKMTQKPSDRRQNMLFVDNHSDMSSDISEP